MAGRTRQRIIEARERLIGLTAVREQLRLRDLSLDARRRRRITRRRAAAPAPRADGRA